MKNQNVQLKILHSQIGKKIPLPVQSTEGSAAFDLHACLDEKLIIHPNETVKIPTGLSLFIKDPAKAGLVLARSGLGSKRGLVPAQMVGLIDSDYQGEICVFLWNRSATTQILEIGERIAQFLLVPVHAITWKIVKEFDENTQRGEKGFGSTGKT